MASRKTCKGKTNGGKKCRRGVSIGKEYCWQHSIQGVISDEKVNVSDQNAFNTTCPICLVDENDNMIILSCLHRLHEDCCKGLTDLNCPLCNQHVVNWPSKIKEIILDNKKKWKEELDEEDRQSALAFQEQNSFLFLQPPPQVEVMGALQFLRESGFPLQFLPENIEIETQRDAPRFEPGVLFETIIYNIVNRIDVGEEIEPELSNSDEDPFEEENEMLLEMTRNIRFVESKND